MASSSSATALEPRLVSAASASSGRPCVRGKFLFQGGHKLYLRGVTYGTFRPDAAGNEYHTPEAVDRDFGAMAAAGINAVRTYTPPPRWLLDAAARHGLLVLVGLPWEQHIAFLDSRRRARDIERRVREGVRACAGHPALLGFAVGNEIPASIVRWYGRRPIERFIDRLYHAAKDEDPKALVTYVNYPTTEYLDLSFTDFFCFNVYLETRDRLEAYIARLHNLAGDRPLVMAEIGLDSRRNGEQEQARALDWQVRTAFADGAAGVFLFSWTDEWHRGGYDIEDWDFGLTTRDRRPKPALASVRRAFAEIPFPPDAAWPFVSVVVCSYNGSRTIGETLDQLHRLDYPNYEILVVDDGSTDATPEIARRFPDVRLISVPNGGLAAARNTGMHAARGEIAAYIDDDAYPDPHWLSYLAYTYLTTSHACVGGPNIAPAGDGPIAECVANAPGGPIHVLLSDREAEHIPGCNSSFRRDRLLAIGGYDPQFRAAGDDVDVCWRLQDRGWTVGFHPAAMVWHHRRNSLRAYWRQQKGYGEAEALLERKYPHKYNVFGHLTWAGRLYGGGLVRVPGRWRIYHGSWGTAPFQSLYQTSAGGLYALSQMPEWYIVYAVLAGLTMLGFLWKPLLAFAPLLAAAVLIRLVQVVVSASRAAFPSGPRWILFAVTVVLYGVQPVARLWGRIRRGLTPWRRRGLDGFAFPRPRVSILWSERWRAPEDWLRDVESALFAGSAVVLRGGDWDRWDLEVRGGLLGAARLRMAVEEHGGGKQLLRFRSWPRVSRFGTALFTLSAALSMAAAVGGQWTVAALLAAVALLPVGLAFSECAGATAAVVRAFKTPLDGVS